MQVNLCVVFHSTMVKNVLNLACVKEERLALNIYISYLLEILIIIQILNTFWQMNKTIVELDWYCLATVNRRACAM